jgi:hypothetical protein
MNKQRTGVNSGVQTIPLCFTPSIAVVINVTRIKASNVRSPRLSLHGPHLEQEQAGYEAYSNEPVSFPYLEQQFSHDQVLLTTEFDKCWRSTGLVSFNFSTPRADTWY